MRNPPSAVCIAAVLTLATTAATAADVGRIETAVYDQMAASGNGKTYVIVMLRDVPFRTRAELPQQKAEVAALQDAVLARAGGSFDVVYRYRTIPALTGRVDLSGLSLLAADPNVSSVGVDGRGEANLNVSVPFIGANTAQANYGVSGNGVTVAVLDTGIDTDHPDLADNIAAGAWHFLNQGATQGAGAEDDNGHGTNVSGIITSAGNVSAPGVAPDADILAVKVLDAGSSGWLSDWTAGIDYVTDNAGNYANLGVMNMSLGSSTLFSQCPCDNANVFNQAMQAALLAARAAGILTFASSGNQGSCTTMSSPACLTSAVAVAAVYDQNLGREPNSGTYQSNFGPSFGACFDDPTLGDKITCFSNQSACNNLAAPGRLITAPGMGGGTSTFTGTSQAAPHCAGVAALMGELRPSLTPDEVLTALRDTGAPSTDLCATNPQPIRINAAAALDFIAPDVPALSTWALIVAALVLVGVFGVYVLRQRRVARHS